jgi:hypothetical protein
MIGHLVSSLTCCMARRISPSFVILSLYFPVSWVLQHLIKMLTLTCFIREQDIATYGFPKPMVDMFFSHLFLPPREQDIATKWRKRRRGYSWSLTCFPRELGIATAPDPFSCIRVIALTCFPRELGTATGAPKQAPPGFTLSHLFRP